MKLPVPEQTLFDRLKASGALLITAESCTGGQIANRITDLSGSSQIYFGGHIVYDNEAKFEFAGVREKILSAYGAVSEEVAKDLVLGTLKQLQKSKPLQKFYLALATTGIAGPTGGTLKKPVGLCFIAAAWGKDQNLVKKIQAPETFTRAQNKAFFADQAIQL